MKPHMPEEEKKNFLDEDQETPKGEEPKKVADKKVVAETKTVPVEKADVQQVNQIKVVPPKLKNSRGEDVRVENYFYTPEGKTPIAPPYFNKQMGLPVEREDLNEIFDKVFLPKDNFVFLKSMDKEVYGVLIPLKYSNISDAEDSQYADFQYHAISFVLDGSVNHQKLAQKLKEIATRVHYEKER